MLRWLMRLFSRRDAAPPPSPPNPYKDVPEPALPAGKHHGRELTIAESEALRAQFATRRKAIEYQLAQRDEEGG